MTRLCFADMGNPEGFYILMGFVGVYFTCLAVSLLTGVIALCYGIFCWRRYRKYNAEHPDTPIVHKNGKGENTAIILLIILGFAFSLGFIGFLFNLLAIIRGRSLQRKAEREGVYQSDYEKLTQDLRKIREQEYEQYCARMNESVLDSASTEDPKVQ